MFATGTSPWRWEIVLIIVKRSQNVSNQPISLRMERITDTLDVGLRCTQVPLDSVRSVNGNGDISKVATMKG